MAPDKCIHVAYELPYTGQLKACVLEPFVYNRNMGNVLEELELVSFFFSIIVLIMNREMLP